MYKMIAIQECYYRYQSFETEEIILHRAEGLATGVPLGPSVLVRVRVLDQVPEKFNGTRCVMPRLASLAF